MLSKQGGKNNRFASDRITRNPEADSLSRLQTEKKPGVFSPRDLVSELGGGGDGAQAQQPHSPRPPPLGRHLLLTYTDSMGNGVRGCKGGTTQPFSFPFAMPGDLYPTSISQSKGGHFLFPLGPNDPSPPPPPSSPRKNLGASGIKFGQYS